MATQGSFLRVSAWVLLALTMLWCVGLLWEQSRLVFSAVSSGILLIAAPVLGICWFAWAIVALVAKQWSLLWILVAIPVSVVLLSVLLGFNAPQQIRWQLDYRQKFAAVAAAIDGGREPGQYVGSRLGDTTVIRVWTADRSTFFDVAERLSFKTPPTWNVCGFAYMPDGQRSGVEIGAHRSPTVWDFHAPWYRYCDWSGSR